MNWLYPGILGALALLAIPVIIHLFYFRRYKTVYFSDIRFLRDLKNETNRFRRLRNLLALILRMLALAMLVLAFAQPFLNKDEEYGEKKAVSIYIDNSYSMSGQYLDVPLLDRAIQKAREIVKAHTQEDVFQVITNEMTGRQQMLMSREETLEYLSRIESSTASVSLNDIFMRQKEAVSSGEESGRLYWISDFQKATTTPSLSETDTLPLFLVPVQAGQPRNIALDSAWFENPVHIEGRNSKLIFQLSNYGLQDVDAIPLSLNYNGEQRPLGNYSIAAGEQLLDSTEVAIGSGSWQGMELKIGDYPVQFDDNYFLSFRVRNKFTVLVINEKNNSYLGKLFRDDSEIQIIQQRLNNLDFSLIAQTDLVIMDDIATISSGLQDQMIKFVSSGGQLLLFPAPNENPENYNGLLQSLSQVRLGNWMEEDREVGSINRREAAFQGVFLEEKNIQLPLVKGSYPVIGSVRSNGRSVLEFRDGKAALIRYPVEDGGAVYLSPAPLDVAYNNLVQMGELIVPMIYNLATQGGARNVPGYTLGSPGTFELQTPAMETEEVYHFISDGVDIIPRQNRRGKDLIFKLGAEFKMPGFYELDPPIQNQRPMIAMNFDRKESDLEVWTPAELQEMLSGRAEVLDQARDVNLSSVIQEKNTGNWLWKYLLGAALLFLLLEVLLLRFWD